MALHLQTTIMVKFPLVEKIGRGRWLMVATFAAGALCFFGLLGTTGIAGWKILHVLGVPALENPFMDLRGVAAWCDAAAQGVDPAKIPTSIRCPDGSDHPNFLMNQLSAGRSGLAPCGIELRECRLFCRISRCAVFLAALFLIGPIDLRDGWVWLLLLVSPLSLLLVERANLDILDFSALHRGLGLAERTRMGRGERLCWREYSSFIPQQASAPGRFASWSKGQVFRPRGSRPLLRLPRVFIASTGIDRRKFGRSKQVLFRSRGGVRYF
jgi:hypothetical protein